MTPAAWPLSPRRPAIAEEPPVGAADSVELAAEDQEPEQDVQAQISLQVGSAWPSLPLLATGPPPDLG